MEHIDRARDIRSGEELDESKIEAFLKENIPGLSGPISIRQFPGGHSNLTYLVVVGDTEMVLRRPPHGTKAKSAHDMGREYHILSKLRPYYPYCPRPLAYTEDESIIGAPFYVMERLKGIILRRDLPPGLELAPDQVRRLYTDLAAAQVLLHNCDYRAAGLEDFGRPEGYVQRQIEGWSKRYRNARTPDAPDCERVMGWLAENMPADSEQPGIVHGDFRMDNVVLDPENDLKIIGVLDWELAALGDPLMDLGASLAYYIQNDDADELQVIRMQPTHLPGAPSRRELVGLYEKMSGRRVEDYDFYYVYGLFRLGVIAQQIYYRFYHQQTQDKRFEAMIWAVTALDNQAQRVLDGARL